MAKKTTAAAKGKAAKRKISSHRGKPTRKKKSQSAQTRGVIGIVILCIGLLALACQFVSSSGGWLNQCKWMMRGLGGMLCLLLPIVIVFIGGALVFFEERRMSVRTIVCSTLIFLFVQTLLQLFQVNGIVGTLSADGAVINYGSFISRSYSYSSYNLTGGGAIGALLAWPLYCALDVWGGALVMLFAIVVALMFLTNLSFSHVGMSLSEWLDDLRTEWNERREEQEALRAKEEEEELARERERAEKRAKKREEREAQLRREEEAARAADEGQMAIEEAQTELPKTKKARKKAPSTVEPAALHIMRPEEAFDENMQLYIERDDEFIRESIDERADVHSGGVQPEAFTIEEAEEAFLYGRDAQRRRRARQGQPAEAQPVYAQEPVYAKDLADGAEASALSASDGAEAQDVWPAQEAEKFTAEQDEALCAPAEMDAYSAMSGEPAFVGYEQGHETIGETEPARQNDVLDEPEEELVFTPVARPAAQPLARSASAAAVTPYSLGESRPSSIPASGVRSIHEVANERAAEPQDKTIVQLRGSRLDGTPIVMPQKDTHDEVNKVEEEYVYPPLDLLERSDKSRDPNQRAKDEEGARKLLATLESFGVQAKMTHVTHGPAITRYELQPAPGVKVSRITNLTDDIALNMAAQSVRIEAPIPGKPAVGIEIPNEKIEMVSLRDVLESQEMMKEKSPTAVALGKGISGAPMIADMAKMPHVLIAGATGSGKSVCINTIINSIIFRASPKEVRLILIDPKVVELSVYNGIPHLLVPVVTDPKKASAALSWAVVEMEHRYKRFETMGVRDIRGYNRAIGPDEEPMSKIIVIIDELADLMMVAPGEVEESICRLAQLARAAGIHLVIATQRPSVNVITGVIKANIPSRIAFAVSSQIDSRTILDSGGAEKLLGKGDMLYAPQGAGKPTRVQGCFVSDDEVQRIVQYVRGNHEAEYSEDVIEMMNAAAQEDKAAAGEAPSGGEPVDEMLAKAIELAVEAGQVSISMLQRRLRVGYARAGRLVDEMTQRGITAEAEGPTKPRAVLISREEWRRMQENQE